MDSRLQELNQLTNTIFQNVSSLTPYLRNVVTHAKQYQKSFQSTCNVSESFILSFQSLADAAAVSHGATKLVGNVLVDIIATFKEVEQMQVNLMKLFINEVIIPLESKAEQEINAIKVTHKGYIHDSKIQTELVDKARQNVLKVRKKCLKKKSKAAKYEQREKDCVRTLAESEKKLQEVREQGLRMALIEERRMYCFVSERMCAYSHGMIAHNGKMNQLLNDRLPDWASVIQRPTELPTESEAIIKNPNQYHYGTIKKKPKRSMSIRSRTDSSSSPLNRTSTMPSRYHTLDTRSVRSNAPSVVSYSLSRQTSTESVPVSRSQRPTFRKESTSSSNTSSSEGSSPVMESSPTHPMMAVLPNDSGIDTNSHTDSNHEEPSTSNIQLSSLKDQLSRRLMQIHPESKLKLKAMYDHAAQDPSQLSFHKHDVIVPICEPTSGWQYGENSRTQMSGWFPSAYMEPLDHSGESSSNDASPVRHDASNATQPPSHPEKGYPDMIPPILNHIEQDECEGFSADSATPVIRKHSNSLPPPAKAPKPKWHHVNHNNNNNTNSVPKPPMPSSHPTTAPPVPVLPVNEQESVSNDHSVVPVGDNLISSERQDNEAAIAPAPAAPVLETTKEEDESKEELHMPAPPPPPPLPPSLPVLESQG